MAERLRSMLTILTPRESLVLTLEYWHDKTQKEIGEYMGICHQRVAQIRTDALRKLAEEKNIVLEPKID